MPLTRRLEQPIPACRAKIDLLKWTENYLRQKAADLSGEQAEYGINFTVLVGLLGWAGGPQYRGRGTAAGA